MDERRSSRIADSLMAMIRVFRVMKGYGEKSGVRILPAEPKDSVLWLLSGKDMRMSELGERLLRSRPNMTAIIDAMEREGLARRTEDASDRRAVRISITAEGRKRLLERKKRIRESIAMNLGRLDDEDLEVLCSSLENINRIAAKLEAG